MATYRANYIDIIDTYNTCKNKKYCFHSSHVFEISGGGSILVFIST